MRYTAAMSSPKRAADIPGWKDIGTLEFPAYAARRGPTPEAPEVIFRTLTYLLWFGLATREIPKGKDWAAAATLTRTQWQWALDGQLEPVWTKYLARLDEADVQAWLALLQHQVDSYKDRELSQKYAARVHSLWFRQIYEVTLKA